MKLLSLSFFTICMALSGFSAAQMSTLSGAKAIEDLPGPPKNPPIFSQMTVIFQGGLQYQSTGEVKGPVAMVEREEAQSKNQSPYAYHTKTTMKFDDDGHLVTEIGEDSLGISTTTNVWMNGKLQSQTVSHHRTDGKIADWSDWQRWIYDKEGHLSEFHAGRDKQEMNHYLNFKYDPAGRPLGYELDAQTVSEIKYEGKKITLSRFPKNQQRKFFEQVQIVDDGNRVIDLRVSDLNGGQLKQWYHVTFKYDDRNRVIEQNTNPFKLGDGDDYSPIPGKLIVEYNDGKRSGEQKFFGTDGKLILHTAFEYDRDGILTKLRLLDTSGKERTGAEQFVDPESHKSSSRPGNTEWDVSYDAHGNWVERRRWFTPTDGSPRLMTRFVRQTIAYR